MKKVRLGEKGRFRRDLAASKMAQRAIEPRRTKAFAPNYCVSGHAAFGVRNQNRVVEDCALSAVCRPCWRRQTSHCGVLGPVPGAPCFVPRASRFWKSSEPWSAEHSADTCHQSGRCCSGNTSLDCYEIKVLISYLREHAVEVGN